VALDTYTNLQTALQAWLARVDVAADVVDMITMFEAWVNRNIRVPQMEQDSIATASEYLPFPVDFLELRAIQWQGNAANPRLQLEYLSPVMADIEDPFGQADTPRFYTIVSNQIRLVPKPDDLTVNIRIDYWKKLPALTLTNQTNWLLSLYPDAYLYGPLVHGNIRVQDVSMAAAVQQGWAGIMAELQRAGKDANVGSLLRIRTA